MIFRFVEQALDGQQIRGREMSWSPGYFFAYRKHVRWGGWFTDIDTRDNSIYSYHVSNETDGQHVAHGVSFMLDRPNCTTTICH